MKIRISGMVTAVLPQEGGTSRNGKPWRKQTYVIETSNNPQYPEPVAFTLMNDRIDQMPMLAGNNYDVDCDLKSREYNGKYYTEVTAWRVAPMGQQAAYQQQPMQPMQPPAAVYQQTPPQAPAAAYPQGDVAYPQSPRTDQQVLQTINGYQNATVPAPPANVSPQDSTLPF